MIPASRLRLFAARAPFPDAAAEALVESCRERLPDLSGLTLVVASPALGPAVRAALTAAAGGAVLGPRIVTLTRYALEALPADAPAPLSALACRLQLAEWLTRLRSVFPGQDPTRVADALHALFEELAGNAVDVPADEADFAARLRAAYRAPPLEALSREARIVHTLWRFYIEEIGDRAPKIAYLRGLSAALADARDTILLGFDRFDRAEAMLVSEALAAGRVALWTQGRVAGRDGSATARLCQRLGLSVVPNAASPDTDPAAPARTRLLDALLVTAPPEAPSPPPARVRATALGASAHEPLGIRLVAAASAEHEARVVDLAVREALLAGARRVAVVSGDRRLARRLRALLERAGLGLEDRVGWALSTSRAAAALSSWLECLETGFHFRALLDLLKAGFFTGDPAQRPEPVLAARLEHRLTFPPRGSAAPPVAGLAAFAQCVDGAYPAVFERLRLAAAELPVNGGPRLGAEWAQATLASLAKLGLVAGLADDDAGSQVIAALRELEAALQGVPLRQRWSEFRALLDRHLEAATFRPTPAGSGMPRVALYTLDQTQGLACDALVLASATRAQLPGSPAGELFFNQSVRTELGLDGWAERQALALARVRRVLEAAPQVIVTYAAEAEGETPQASAWLGALDALAVAAGHPSLHDDALAVRAAAAEAQIAAADPVDSTPATPPAPAARPALLSLRLSASGHQALIDCPYRWHAQYALRLVPGTAPDDPVTRADFGERVHAILLAFHHHADPALPPPYAGVLEPAAVGAHLESLADAVFAPDLASRPLARIWRREFAAMVPWLAQQLVAGGAAETVQVEWEAPRELAGWQLHGKIDRLERHPGGHHVIDYKTGRNVPKPAEIECGEAVQLPHYGLEAGTVARLEYWKLGEDDADKRIQAVPDEALTPLLAAIEQRLAQLHRDVIAGHPLPANGDDASCAHCDFSGVCRRDAWTGAA